MALPWSINSEAWRISEFGQPGARTIGSPPKEGPRKERDQYGVWLPKETNLSWLPWWLWIPHPEVVYGHVWTGFRWIPRFVCLHSDFVCFRARLFAKGRWEAARLIWWTRTARIACGLTPCVTPVQDKRHRHCMETYRIIECCKPKGDTQRTIKHRPQTVSALFVWHHQLLEFQCCW